MTLDTAAHAGHTFEVLDLRCRRCGKSFRHYKPDQEIEGCDSTACVCNGCGELCCLSLWEDGPTHETLRAIRSECGGRPDAEAAMIGERLPRCRCGGRIAVYGELCPSCGSRNHVTMFVSTESRQVSRLSLAGDH
jgi:hypothetical protein